MKKWRKEERGKWHFTTRNFYPSKIYVHMPVIKILGKKKKKKNSNKVLTFQSEVSYPSGHIWGIWKGWQGDGERKDSREGDAVQRGSREVGGDVKKTLGVLTWRYTELWMGEARDGEERWEPPFTSFSLMRLFVWTRFLCSFSLLFDRHHTGETPRTPIVSISSHFFFLLLWMQSQ